MSERRRILVVDEEPQLTRVLRTGLTSHSYDVRVAADGAAALSTLGNWPPDHILTGLSMPDTDGLELCRRLRQISQVPIIVLSVRGGGGRGNGQGREDRRRRAPPSTSR